MTHPPPTAITSSIEHQVGRSVAAGCKSDAPGHGKEHGGERSYKQYTGEFAKVGKDFYLITEFCLILKLHFDLLKKFDLDIHRFVEAPCRPNCRRLSVQFVLSKKPPPRRHTTRPRKEGRREGEKPPPLLGSALVNQIDHCKKRLQHFWLIVSAVADEAAALEEQNEPRDHPNADCGGGDGGG